MFEPFTAEPKVFFFANTVEPNMTKKVRVQRSGINTDPRYQ